jgi:broad specificity phosphatase PhoE
MKKIYFVRHGESEGNAVKRSQTRETPLSRTGIEQAKFVAKRFETIPIDLIVASPYIRTSQTADEIVKVIKKPLRYSELLRERKRPTQLEGQLYEHKDFQSVLNTLKENIHRPEWRYSDEENFFDLQNRAKDAIQYIEQLDKKNICVVTHGGILLMIVLVMALGDELTPHQFLRFEEFFLIKNTGITICEKKENDWRLITWNDHAHLGEV